MTETKVTRLDRIAAKITLPMLLIAGAVNFWTVAGDTEWPFKVASALVGTIMLVAFGMLYERRYGVAHELARFSMASLELAQRLLSERGEGEVARQFPPILRDDDYGSDPS